MSTIRSSALVLAALALVAAAPAAGNQVLMSDCNFGFHDEPYGTHEIVCVTGDLDCDDDYPFPPWPVAEIFIVVDTGQQWTDGHVLVDAMGSSNTVDGTGLGGGFYDIELAYPPLPIGRYDVVIDENEDGIYNPCLGYHDYVLGQGAQYAFEVLDYGLDPVIDKEELKAQEQILVQEWTTNCSNLRNGVRLFELGHSLMGMAGSFAKIRSWKQGIYLFIVNRVGAHLNADGRWYKWVFDEKKLMNVLCARLVDRHQDIVDDPPDPEYDEIVALGAIEYLEAETGDSLAVARVKVLNAIQEEGALLDAARRALEKFSGAATDVPPANTYVRVQTLAAKEYAELLLDTVDGANAALAELRSVAVSSGTGDLSFHPDSMVAYQSRVSEVGFYPEEIQLMADGGLSHAEMESMRQDILNWDLSDATEGTMVAHIDDAVQSNADLADAYQSFLDGGVQAILDTTAQVWVPHPTADAGGPYAGSEGSPLVLDGSGSSDPLGEALDFAWDLDSDGEFDDGSSPTISHTWNLEGTRIIGLRVTNQTGYCDVGYARLTVSSINDGPTFEAIQPESCYVPLETMAPVEFAVTAHDPDGDPISYAWTLGDSVVGSGQTWLFDPSVVGAGRHAVAVRISDGSPHSPDNGVTWRVDLPASDVEAEDEAAVSALRIEWAAYEAASARVAISLLLPRGGDAHVVVYNAAGRRIRDLAVQPPERGRHVLEWDGRDSTGVLVASGVYMLRLMQGEATARAKVVVVR